MAAREVGREDGVDARRVALSPEFLTRLEQLAARTRARRAREDLGLRRGTGRGVEFEGHRPYRAGEDLRDLDWELLARTDQPFVRVRRAELGEHWAIVLDTSGSMGLGNPPKLQRAAEVALAIGFVALGLGVASELVVHGDGGAVQVRPLRSRAEFARWIELVGKLAADGRRPVQELLASPRLARARRVIVIGDLLDLQPAQVLSLVRPGKRVATLRLLAPHELAPELSEGVEWLDPETGARVEARLDERTVDAYGRSLESTLAAWRDAFARRGQLARVASSAEEFETLAGSLFE
ncbi:MAG: DUF58 domain-containing protein [Planctomycetota bacterium]|nr:DUF58 domain-containing protein [Planctomycetota bacterium]